MDYTKDELLEEIDYLEGAAHLPPSERTRYIRAIIEQWFGPHDIYADMCPEDILRMKEEGEND